jgi:hypothetical protein
MAVLSERRAHFYLAAYPRLLCQLDRLIEAIRRSDPNIASAVLFGAAVRLRPLPTSSANLLFSVHDVGQFLFAPASPAPDQPDMLPLRGCTGVQLVRSLQRAPGDGWQLSGVVSDLDGEDLGPAMLQHIAQEGVLLYTDGVPLPKPLRDLRDAALWRDDVEALLAKCRKMLAEDTLVAHQSQRTQRESTPLSRSVVWDLDLEKTDQEEPRA